MLSDASRILSAKQVGVLKESCWNSQQVGVLRVDASSPTDMLRQMCQELSDVRYGKGQLFGFPIFNGNAAVLYHSSYQ